LFARITWIFFEIITWNYWLHTHVHMDPPKCTKLLLYALSHFWKFQII
jgi:hypothetical protein